MPEEEKSNSDEIGETSITITLPSTAYFISGIRDFTLTLVKNTTNFPEKWAFRFQSVIDELCNNAIEYGSSDGSDVRITFFRTNEYLQITVEDTGTGKGKTTAKDLKKLFEERRESGYVFTGIRGRGLAKIIGEWTDEINFEDRPEGGIKVSVKKFLQEPRKNPENISQETKKANKITLET